MNIPVIGSFTNWLGLRLKAEPFWFWFITLSCTVLLVSASFFSWVTYRSNINLYPEDAWWWEGTVADTYKWGDGDQDFWTTDGYRLVNAGPDVTVGEKIHILHARNEAGQAMTYRCLTKDRSQCYTIDLVITFPLETFTTNQGTVPPSEPTVETLKRLGAGANPKS